MPARVTKMIGYVIQADEKKVRGPTDRIEWWVHLKSITSHTILTAKFLKYIYLYESTGMFKWLLIMFTKKVGCLCF